MTEAELQAAVIDACRLGGWRVAHFRTALNARGHYMTAVAGDGAGFPDLLIVPDHGYSTSAKAQHRNHHQPKAWELKSAKGRVSVEQSEWLRVLAPWMDTGVIRPDHLDEAIWILTGAR